MFLFELAMELDARSAEMAEAAPGLGLEGVTPTSELTPEQVQVLRARFAKVPVVAGSGGPPGGGAYQPPSGGPTPGAAGAPPPPKAPSGGLGLGQMLLILMAVIAVVGLFAYMFTTGGTDQDRLDRIAAAGPAADDGVQTTGPDGKPLTDEQRFNLAKMEAAKAANDEKACSALRAIRNADIAMSNANKSVGSFDEWKGLLIQASNESIPLYDQAIAVVPPQADNMRKLQQFSRDTVASIGSAGDLTDLQARMQGLSDQARRSGTIAAAASLDAFAMDTCGFSTGNN